MVGRGGAYCTNTFASSVLFAKGSTCPLLRVLFFFVCVNDEKTKQKERMRRERRKSSWRATHNGGGDGGTQSTK